MKRLGAMLIVAAVTCAAQAQDAGRNWLTFRMDRTGPMGVHYSIKLDQESGRGFYRSDDPAPAGAIAPSASGQVPISVPPATLKKLFAAVPLVKSNRCDSRNKSIAQTGVKTLRYSADAATFECTYNYGLEDRLNTATALFEALAETMQYGDRLSAKLRFDRLGLDGELEDLQAALNDGRALEVENIAPVLTAIQNDERVMDRARRKATRLLESAGQQGAQRAEDGGTSER